jgi:hypothetical protein
MVLPFMVLPIMTLPPSMHYFRLSSSIGVTTLELVSYDDNISLPEWEQQLSIAVLWSTPFHNHFISLLSHGLHHHSVGFHSHSVPMVYTIIPLVSTPPLRWFPSILQYHLRLPLSRLLLLSQVMLFPFLAPRWPASVFLTPASCDISTSLAGH